MTPRSDEEAVASSDCNQTHRRSRWRTARDEVHLVPAGQREEALNPFAQFKILEFPDGREFNSEFRKFSAISGLHGANFSSNSGVLQSNSLPRRSREFFRPNRELPRSARHHGIGPSAMVPAGRANS